MDNIFLFTCVLFLLVLTIGLVWSIRIRDKKSVAILFVMVGTLLAAVFGLVRLGALG